LLSPGVASAACGREPGGAEFYPLGDLDFEYGLRELRCYVQSGGHAYEIQHPAELGAARAALRRDGVIDPSEQAAWDEAGHWRVLLQDAVDEDGIMIGYWLLREDDLAAGRFDRAYFTMQR
jgi:hypothetical protein